MNKYDVNDPLIAELMNDPQVIALQNELAQYVNNEYAAFDTKDVVGSTPGDLIKTHYMYSKGGFFNVEIADGVAKDKELVCSLLPIAINDALVKYANESKEVSRRIREKETELYNKLVAIAQDRANKELSDDSTPVVTPPIKKKTYLN